jgi:O-methyltransferase
MLPRRQCGVLKQALGLLLSMTNAPLESNQSVRKLSLDLLSKSVSNCIYGPVPSNLWRDGLFGVGSFPGRDKRSPARTMVGLLRLENVLELTQRVIDLDIPGHLIETGVWRGGCCIMMRGVLAANMVTDRSVYADSFAGVPKPKPRLYPLDFRSRLHAMPELAVSLETVQSNFRKYDLLDDQVVFVKGFSSDTLPLLPSDLRFALIRLDGDLYELTRVALECLYPKLSVGGFCIIDDYGAIPQCRQAVTEFREEMTISEPICEIDWTGVFWQKSK